MASEEEPPNLEEMVSRHLLCPISQCIMEQPVVAPTGHTYDRKSIVAWLARRSVDPLTGWPMSANTLFPNRALRDEVLDQLEKLSQRGLDDGDTPLAEAAAAKIKAVQAESSALPEDLSCDRFTCFGDAGRLEKLADRCAHWAAWCAEFAMEQALVLTTSLGALTCLALDIFNGSLLGGKVTPALAGVGTGSGPRPFNMISTFLRLAVVPDLPPPRHWRGMSYVTVLVLRCVLLAPLVPACLALTLGSGASLLRFALHFRRVRAVVSEQASQNHAWVRAKDLGSAFTGLASFGVFLRLYADYRAERNRR